MPTSDKEYKEAMLKALFNVELFGRFFNDFQGNKVPRPDIFGNILHRQYGIPIEDTSSCADILLKNAKELNLLKDIKGSQWVEISSYAIQTIATPELGPLPDATNTAEVGSADPTPSAPPEPDNVVAPISWKPKVFIAHSKNAKILNTIKRILNYGQFDFVVAEETPTTSIPIPEKIFGLMRECNSAIINVSADEQERLDDGAFRINENVLIEIGGAYLAYNQKVILLVDDKIMLPSNLQGLAQYRYSGEDLSPETTLDLLESLAKFRSLSKA